MLRVRNKISIADLVRVRYDDKLYKKSYGRTNKYLGYMVQYMNDLLEYGVWYDNSDFYGSPFPHGLINEVRRMHGTLNFCKDEITAEEYHEVTRYLMVAIRMSRIFHDYFNKSIDEQLDRRYQSSRLKKYKWEDKTELKIRYSPFNDNEVMMNLLNEYGDLFYVKIPVYYKNSSIYEYKTLTKFIKDHE
jgi:hypothetical protein